MLDTDTKRRIDTAHPNGSIFFSTQAALDAKITEILHGVLKSVYGPDDEHGASEQAAPSGGAARRH